MQNIHLLLIWILNSIHVCLRVAHALPHASLSGELFSLDRTTNDETLIQLCKTLLKYYTGSTGILCS